MVSSRTPSPNRGDSKNAPQEANTTQNNSSNEAKKFEKEMQNLYKGSSKGIAFIFNKNDPRLKKDKDKSIQDITKTLPIQKDTPEEIYGYYYYSKIFFESALTSKGDKKFDEIFSDLKKKKPMKSLEALLTDSHNEMSNRASQKQKELHSSKTPTAEHPIAELKGFNFRKKHNLTCDFSDPISIIAISSLLAKATGSVSCNQCVDMTLMEAIETGWTGTSHILQMSSTNKKTKEKLVHYVNYFSKSPHLNWILDLWNETHYPADSMKNLPLDKMLENSGLDTTENSELEVLFNYPQELPLPTEKLLRLKELLCKIREITIILDKNEHSEKNEWSAFKKIMLDLIQEKVSRLEILINILNKKRTDHSTKKMTDALNKQSTDNASTEKKPDNTMKTITDDQSKRTLSHFDKGPRLFPHIVEEGAKIIEKELKNHSFNPLKLTSVRKKNSA